LRLLLPLVRGHDDALIELLEERAAAWETFLRLAEPGRHMPDPRDPHLMTLGFQVVRALDGAETPLTVRRDTVVVEVLRLVRQWADLYAGRPPRRYRDNYKFSRAVVAMFLTYKKSLPTRPAKFH